MSQNSFYPFDAGAYFNSIQPAIENQENVKINPEADTLSRRNFPLCEKSFSYGMTKAEIYRKVATEFKVQDWSYWLNLDSWTPEQASCLFYEIDPDKLPKNKFFDDAISQLSEELVKLYRLAAKKGEMLPCQWKTFALEKKLVIPRPIYVVESMPAIVEELTNNNEWLIPDERDKPAASEDWQIAARYFYREHKKSNTELLKKDIVKLVSNDLEKHQLYKRGGKQTPSESSIEKILQNIEL